MKRWLITGGCGFIGRNLVRELIRGKGVAVRIIDNLVVGSRQELEQIVDVKEWSGTGKTLDRPAAESVDLVVGDILDEDLAMQCCRDVDVVVHLAANTGVGPSVENPRMDCLTNVLGTFNYLEAARTAGVQRFVFASSGAPAGECTPPIHEELPPHPVSPYGASKLAGEGYCSAYFRTYGMETVALRFSNVYGPFSSSKESVVAKFMRNGLQGKELTIFGDGMQTRDFLYVDDLVMAIIQASTGVSIGGEVFQIATGRETSISEIVGKISSLFNELLPTAELRIIHEQVRAGDVSRNFSDITKAKELLGWQPMVGLDQGLKATLQWFLQKS